METTTNEGYFTTKRGPRIAWRIIGFPKVWVPYTYLETDDDGQEYEADSGEGEWEEDESSGRVVAVMVGDDRKTEMDFDDLVPLPREDFCGECGQVGCTCDGYDRGEVK